MASSDLRAKLICFICKNNYTDPVMLPCGDKFCRLCIDHVLNKQGRSGGYSCPKCRENFPRRPALQRNTSSTCRVQPYQKKHGEASLYNKHPRTRNTAPDHVLSDPTTSSQIGKCSTHIERMKFYCIKDDICICASCRWAGEHQGHQVETLDEASGKRKTKLRNVKQKLLTKREETEERVQSLQEHRRKVEEKAAGETEIVTAVFRDLSRRLEDLEKRLLREISEREERISISIRDLEIKKEELSRKLRHIEELCNVTDPLTVLQESDTGDLCDTEDGDNEDRERRENLLHDGGCLDVAGVLYTLHTLSAIITEVNVYFYKQKAADILLDGNTAHNFLYISDDRKTISWSDRNQKRPETLERFTDFPQVLSSQSFSSGQHYWDVDVGGSDLWRVGMCYPSMDRRGVQTGIGMDNKSWGLLRCDNQCSVRHGSIETPLPTNIYSNRVRIYLDYEAGQISFYDLCDEIRHLFTFTTPFTEPLHAGLGIKKGCIKICGGNWKM